MITALVLAFGVVATDIVVRAVRLRVLLGARSGLRLAGAVAINAYGDAASSLTPARLGGEPARFLAMQRRGIPGSAAVVALATERIVDVGLAVAVTVMAIGLLGTAGFGDVSAYLRRLTSPRVLPWLVVVAAVVVAFAVLALRVRHRMPRVERSLRDAAAHARTLAGARLVAATVLTAVSMAARVAVLPALLWGSGALTDPVTAAVGSFALLYAQLLLPTPAGAGAVELGFVVGVAPMLAPDQVASLLVLWRTCTLFVPAGLGVAIFLVGRRQLDRRRKAAST